MLEEKFGDWTFELESISHWGNREGPPKAVYSYKGSREQHSAFKVYKDLLKAASTGNEGFAIVEDGICSTSNYAFKKINSDGSKSYVSTGQEIINAACEDNLDVVSDVTLNVTVRSRESPYQAYLFTYNAPGVLDPEYETKNAADGQVRVSAATVSTKKFGGKYDKTSAYTEIKHIVKTYAPDRMGNEYISKLGKGENSRINFRPIRKRK